MPYAFCVDDGGQPDAEARARLNEALEVVIDLGRRSVNLPIMFLGAGMPERTRPRGAESLAASMASYLEDRGCPSHKIAQRPIGYSTVTETFAFYTYLKRDLKLKHMTIHVVTSWWHLIRVWIVCRIVFGFKMPMKFHASSSPHRGGRLAYDIIREIPAMPRSAFMAWRAVRKLAA